tara:strand:- start:1095 stop:2615 length:1521 start_codon:yes stop_codon:yes gene_type:complete
MKTKATLIFIFIAAILGFTGTVSSKFLEYTLNKQNSLSITNSHNRVSMNQSTLPEIEVTKLDDVQRSSVGLLPATVTGFPTSLWKESQADDLVGLLRTLGSPSSPAIQKLLFQMLLAEAEAPITTDGAEEFLSERISILIEAGAIDPAIALLERASPLPPQLVPKLFEASLLGSQYEPACKQVLDLGANYYDDAGRIYCYALEGDWLTASLIYNTSKALDSTKPSTLLLLGEFLEIEESSEKFILSNETNLSPLDFKLYEALGYPVYREDLGNAFIFGDLSGDNGWYVQLTAAEKLAETGVIDANRFLGIFTAYDPPSSDGIWERVRAIQRLDEALSFSNSMKEVEFALKNAWKLFKYSPNSSIFAEIFTPRLLDIELTPSSEIMAIKIGMLSSSFDVIVSNSLAVTALEPIVFAFTNQEAQFVKPATTLEETLLDAFYRPRVPSYARLQLADGKLGEVILNALIQLESGIAGDMQDLLESISTLRHVGLERVSQRTALWLILSET